MSFYKSKTIMIPHFAMIERLETRRLFATLSLATGTVFITGTSGDDVITITINPTGTFIDPTTNLPVTGPAVSITENGVLFEFKDSDVNEFLIRTFDGNDTVSIDNQKIDLPCTIFAGSGDDNIASGDGPDSIFGEDGFDQLFGRAGIDSIHGGQQGDFVLGGDDDDIIFGGRGHDVLLGGIGTDFIYGRGGNDVLWGNGTLVLDQSSNLLFGDDGNDTINAYENGAFDTIYGGAGSDIGLVDGSHELTNAAIEDYQILLPPIDIFNPPPPS
jgi:Ca2+-binding RTX toxin-like protein